MSMANTGDAGDAPRLVDEHVVAVYDPEDGRVLHLHTVRVFEGARSVSPEEAVEEALNAARGRGHDTERAQTLHTKEAPGRGVHRVDLATTSLVPAEEPRRR